MKRYRCANAGFTLLEILVAMAVFAIFAYMAYGGFNAVARQQAIVAESAQRLREVQYAMRRLALDLSQLQPRPVREQLGDGWQPALTASGLEFNALEFTRGGWPNPLARPRPTLQRVAYRVEEETLIRSQWLNLDRLLDQEPDELEVLTGVREIRFRFLLENGEWIEVWPSDDLNVGGTPPGAESYRVLPRGVEITLDLEDWGEVTRVVEIAG
ncbi:MAG: type II secretion system minor pseudopilin GspJ [Gammaproteobacteria bacterium]